MKPLVKWAGGKSQLLPQIKANMPDHFNRYIEPFAGGAALFFDLERPNSIIIDANPELINYYQIVSYSKQLEQMIAYLKAFEFSENWYYMIRKWDRCPTFADLPKYQRAARFIYLNKTCYNGLWRVNSQGQFNTPIGKYKKAPDWVNQSGLVCAKSLFGNTSILHGDYQIAGNLTEWKDFVYFDPPYHPEASEFTRYAAKDFGHADHLILATLCRNLNKRGVYWMVSNIDCDAVRSLWQGFNFVKVEAKRSINSKSQGRGKVTEVLIKNY